MVKRTLRNKELAEMDVKILEKQLFQNINSIFEHADIIAVRIKNIQVEKVDR